MGISSLGVGTNGIDTASMLDQLKASEQTRLLPFTNRQSSYNAKISNWGVIKNSLTSLQGIVKKLSGEAFNSLTVSTNENFTATAGAGALADTHSVTVKQLASAHKLRTEAQDSADNDLGSTSGSGTRTINITQTDSEGKETTLSVELKDDETSLNDIAKAINKQKGNVNASVQRTDDGYQLVLSSKTTGTDGKMTVKVEGDDSLAGMLDTSNGGHGDDNMVCVSDPLDAKVIVDGDTYTRSTNNISDIIDGVTLNLKSVTPDGSDGTPGSEQLTLTADPSAIKSTLQDFVKQYNSLLGQTSAASKYVPNDATGMKDDEVASQNAQNGALMGDSTLRDMVSEIRGTVNGVYGDSGADYGSLADLGIKIDAGTGQMTLDEDKLDEAIADNPDEIANMFTEHNDVPGLASKLGDIITKYVGDPDSKVDGIITSTTDVLQDQVKQVQDQIDKTQKLIDGQVEIYRVQFENLDTAMSKMTSLSSQLTSLLSSV
ncbi:flagellar cap protein [Leclercia adecarboxylata]|nr:flagellar cap protein [Leclercia adecarboxylata]KMN61750.1 flagellar cap protein [Leclercia sp. LK8]